MPESRSGVSAFETRLAAMDQRLRELQEELAPSSHLPVDPIENGEGMPRASVRPGAAPAPMAPPRVEPARDILVPLYERLLASMRELLSGYELVVGGVGSGGLGSGGLGSGGLGSGGLGAGGVGSGGAQRSEVAVSAGPFSGTPALRDFERALSELPGVQAVSLRGYDTDERAVWDVQLR